MYLSHATRPDTNASASDFNVLDFGARGDGVQDDWSSIMQAMAAAGPSGAKVIFPPGIYIISKPLLWDRQSSTSIEFAPSLIGAPGRSGLSQSFGNQSTTCIRASSDFPLGEFLIDYIGPTATDKCITSFAIVGLTLDCNTLAAGYRMCNTYESTIREIIITQSPRTPAPANTIGSPAGAANHVASPTANAWNNYVSNVQITNAQQDGFFFNEGSGSYLIANACYSSVAGRYGFVIGDLTTVINSNSKQSSNTSTGGADWKVQGNATLIGCKSPGAKPVNGSGIVLSLSSNQRAQMIGCEFYGPTAAGLSDSNGAVVRILAATGMSVEFIGCNFLTGGTTTKTFVYISASSSGVVLFSGSAFIQTNGAPASGNFILNSNKVISFVSCQGINSLGAITVTPASGAWTNNNPVSVDVYISTAGSYTGTTTITPNGGSAVTIPNAIAGGLYRIPAYATLTWGVGGSITSDPSFLGFGN
jgi:hypothetical protein